MAIKKSSMLEICLPLLALLETMHDCGGSYGVVADNLIQAGMAVEGGYARAEDDREGPRLYLTKAGEVAAKSRR